ncbi:hypothetical protein LZC94_01620 [Pendulispora albinea]|uniref:Uncharacterized protein n=1 Tax=Pendulispora albinea TaxID=2741071 RepID=A0ABZ2LYL7_9BACT
MMGDTLQVIANGLGQGAGLPGLVQKQIVQRGMQPGLLGRAVELLQLVARRIDLAQKDAIGELVGDAAHLGEPAEGLGLSFTEDVFQLLGRGSARAGLGVRGLVAQARVLGQDGRGVDAKSVHPAPEPKAHGVVDGRANIGLAQVQVGLAAQKGVVEKLLAPRLPLPRAPAEPAYPIVGRAAIGPRVRPDVPIVPRVRARRSALDEPRVRIGRVVRYEVEDEPNPAAVELFEHPVEVAERAEDGVDIRVICNIVPEVDHRRWVDGPEPNGVDPEPRQVIEPRQQAR